MGYRSLGLFLGSILEGVICSFVSSLQDGVAKP